MVWHCKETAKGDEEMPVRVTRGGITESIHEVYIVAMSGDGKKVAGCGDDGFVTFARSSMKPIQAIPLVESGALEKYKFEDADLAQCCASHSSENMHIERVSNMLTKLELDESFLRCGGHQPHSEETFYGLIRAGRRPTALYSNCSGKHTGMLMYCRHKDLPLDSYHWIGHPLQQEIFSILSELSESPPDTITVGVDGCGVPAFALTIRQWATAFSKFASPESYPHHAAAMKRISHAMRGYPELVGGTGRFDTNLMLATNGRLLAKGGAEGFFLVVDTDREMTIVWKVRDGNARALPPVVIKTLIDLSLLRGEEHERLDSYTAPIVQNTLANPVGEIVADVNLQWNL